jgi:zinc protease
LLASDLDQARVHKLFAPIVARWKTSGSRPIAAAAPAPGPQLERTRLFLIDKPGAAQSEVRVGHLSVSSLDPDYYPLTVLNYILGGAFSSRINLNLREDKGYTYGARSGFEGGLRPGAFVASAAVATDVTAPALAELLGELERFLDGVTADELEFARSALTQALLRQYEGTQPRLALGDNVSRFGWPDDYPSERLAVLAGLTTLDVRALAQRHWRPAELSILVVGDRERVRAPLEGLGRGPVRELDGLGNPLG